MISIPCRLEGVEQEDYTPAIWHRIITSSYYQEHHCAITRIQALNQINFGYTAIIFIFHSVRINRHSLCPSPFPLQQAQNHFHTQLVGFDIPCLGGPGYDQGDSLLALILLQRASSLGLQLMDNSPQSSFRQDEMQQKGQSSYQLAVSWPHRDEGCTNRPGD